MSPPVSETSVSKINDCHEAVAIAVTDFIITLFEVYSISYVVLSISVDTVSANADGIIIVAISTVTYAIFNFNPK